MSGALKKRGSSRCPHTMRVTGRDGITRCGDCGKTLKPAAPRALDALNQPPASSGKDPAKEAWRSQAADEVDAIADLWSGDGRFYAKTIAAVLRAEEPEQLPPADSETRHQAQRAWERFKAGTSDPEDRRALSGKALTGKAQGAERRRNADLRERAAQTLAACEIDQDVDLAQTGAQKAHYDAIDAIMKVLGFPAPPASSGQEG